MKCEHCTENEARYTNTAGEKLCSLCDMKSGNVSVRDIDLPYLLVLCEEALKTFGANNWSVTQRMHWLLSNSRG